MRLSGRTLIVAGTAAGAAGVVTAARVAAKRRATAAQEHTSRKHVITVNRPYDELASEQIPGSLAELGDAVEVVLRSAPGDRGTEIAVRAVDPSMDAGRIRRALRETRSLIEVGDVLLPGGPTTEPTLLNRPLRKATEHGREGGLL